MSTHMIKAQPRPILQRVGGWIRSRILAVIGYEGATTGRRGANWIAPAGHPDEIAMHSLPTLRARARHMVRNHWAAARSVDVLTTHIVGAGILPSCRHEDEFNALLTEFARPQAQVGSQKGQSLGAVQRLVCRTVIESGSCLVVRVRRTTKEMKARGLVLPFQLQVLEPEYLDTMKDGRLPSGHTIIHGIEYDASDWPVAYHLHQHHPGSSLYLQHRDSSRVPAEDVCHVYWQRRAGQTVGVPWFAPVLVKLRDFDDYEDAQLLRQKIAAMFVGFVRSNLGTGAPSSTDDISLEPGRLQFLEDGEEVTFANPPGVDGFGEYAHITLRSIAAGLGISYEDLSADYSRVNFSSARMGSIVSRALVDVWQQEMMIGQLCQSLDGWIAEAAELLNYEPHEIRWTAPRRELLDPSREVGAIERAIAAGLTSRQEEVRKLGRDVLDVDEERAQDRAREAEMGLSVDAQPPDSAPDTERIVEEAFTSLRIQ